MTALSPCATLIRTHHRTAYLATLLAPAHVSEAMAALYAFNYEIEHIRTTVSEEMVGMIRLQWWRDAVAAMYEGKQRNHDVVKGLAQAIELGALEQAVFEPFFRAHEEDYTAAPFQTIESLLNYADHTYGIMLHFTLKIHAIKQNEAYEAAIFIARAELLCNHLRQLPYHLKEGWCTLPLEWLQKQHISSDALLAGDVGLSQLEPVIGAAIQQAEAAYQQANQLKSALSEEAKKALRIAALIPSQLRIFKRKGNHILQEPVTLSPLLTPLRLWKGW